MARPRADAGPKPNRVRVRMYQVGFGDCFLVSFEYAAALTDGRKARHVLIDFGSTRAPVSGGLDLVDVGTQVAADCGGQLDVLVLTHRHKDHLQGFGLKASAEIIDRLKPKLVVRPWTENPDVGAEATGPHLGPESRRFLESLHEAQSFAGQLAAAIDAKTGLRAETTKLAFDQLPNLDAIHNLDRWAATGEASYVSYGTPSQIEKFVPGIRVRVLGPPTIAESPEVATQRADNPDYWISQRGLLGRALSQTELGPRLLDGPLAPTVAPGPVGWLVDRLRDQHIASLLRIVRTVDDALNNTSVILLIDAGDKRLLFPGDAQIENWSYSLSKAPDHEDLRKLLSEVDLYKVGHHGSRNATPRTLFGLWEADPARPLTTLMSTMPGVHGRSEGTRVPRSTLVAALEHRTSLWATNNLPPGQIAQTVEAPLSGGHPFAPVPAG